MISAEDSAIWVIAFFPCLLVEARWKSRRTLSDLIVAPRREECSGIPPPAEIHQSNLGHDVRLREKPTHEAPVYRSILA